MALLRQFVGQPHDSAHRGGLMQAPPCSAETTSPFLRCVMPGESEIDVPQTGGTGAEHIEGA